MNVVRYSDQRNTSDAAYPFVSLDCICCMKKSCGMDIGLFQKGISLMLKVLKVNLDRTVLKNDPIEGIYYYNSIVYHISTRNSAS